MTVRYAMRGLGRQHPDDDSLSEQESGECVACFRVVMWPVP